MGEIIPFVFKHDQKQTPIRVVIIDGKAWFVGVDGCDVLDLDPKSAFKKLKPGEKGTHLMRTPGGLQQMVVISRNGLMRLVMRSDKPQAAPFQDWIIEEVIPALFDHGRYELAWASREPDLLAAINGVETRLGARLDGIDQKLDSLGGRFPPAVLRYVGAGVAKYESCKCIYCHEVDVVTEYGEKLATCHGHHVNGNNADNRPENCTLPCIECHKRLTYQRRRDAIPEYEALAIASTFHRKLKLKTRQIRPPHAVGFWDFSIAVQADMGFAAARKKRSA